MQIKNENCTYNLYLIIYFLQESVTCLTGNINNFVQRIHCINDKDRKIRTFSNERTCPWGFFRTCHLNTYNHEMMSKNPAI